MDMVCIVCPNGCRLKVEKIDGKVVVSGNKCRRGAAFAESELTCPMRSVTSTVRTTIESYPVVSVRTNGEIPKSKVGELVELLNNTTLHSAVKIGSVILTNVLDTGVDVITTTNMED